MEGPAEQAAEQAIAPLDVDGTRTVAVGTTLWLLAFLVLLPFHERLQAAHQLWWMWTCLAGFGLGVVGWGYCHWRKRARQSARPEDPDHPDPAQN